MNHMPNISIEKSKAIATVIVIALISFGFGFLASNLAKPKSSANGFSQAAFGQGGQRGAMMGANRTGRAGGAGFINGTLLKKDATSMTVKLRDGSSKLVLIASSTKALKMADTTLDEFTVGSEVMINGTPNSDGSVTAQTVQVRPTPPPDAQQPGQPQPLK